VKTLKPELLDALGTLVAGMAIGIAYSLSRPRSAAVSGETAAG
jgi:xanthosine utilization system XapX-like protein